MAKHIPERMCLGCRTMAPKDNLIKIVIADGVPVVDEGHKLFGRSAYICKNEACIDLARKKKALQRTFKMPVEDTFYEQVKGWTGG